MDLNLYQERALTTSKYALEDREAQLAILLGLHGEAGSLSALFKKWVRDDLKPEDARLFIKQELGDLLWYTAVLARAQGLNLNEIAEHNLARTNDIFPSSAPKSAYLVDGVEVPDTQRFPRRMSWLFTPTVVDGKAHVRVQLKSAEPNAFPAGSQQHDGAHVGYDINMEFGNEINDNEYSDDGYRFHDALHFAFVGILGWSPVVRGLMRIKRKYNTTVDRVEDGARARDTEEAISATLKKFSIRRNNFQNEGSIDAEILEIVQTLSSGREAQHIPLGHWRHAIHVGFVMMHKLHKRNGGLLHIDMDQAKVWIDEGSASEAPSPPGSSFPPSNKDGWFGSVAKLFRTQ